jgi:DNA-binding SARP family transcriptional activator
LLINANKTVSTNELVDAVWVDNPPNNGANVVQKYVAGLRRALEPERAARAPAHRLLRTEGGYRLRVDHGCLDSELLVEMQADAAEMAVCDAPEATVAKLRDALSLWHGEPFAGLAGPEFDRARDRLAEARAGIWEMLADIEIAAGRHRQMIAELIRLVADFPLRDEPRYLLMLALYRSGRQVEALEVYQDGRSFLADEFGIEPSDRLRELQLRILRADPELDLTPAPTVRPKDAPRPAALTRRPPEVVRPRPVVGVPPAALTRFPPPAVMPAGPVVQVSTVTAVPVWLLWLAKAGAVIVPLMTLGLGGSLLVGALAVARRRAVSVFASLGYLLAIVASLLIVGFSEHSPVGTAIGFLLWYALVAATIVHGVRLVPSPPRPRDGVANAVLRIVAAAVPVLTLGFAQWMPIAYHAIRRRSSWLAAAAVGYAILPVSIVFGLGLELDRAEPSDAWTVALGCMVLLSIVAAAHAACLSPNKHRVPRAPRQEIVQGPPPVPVNPLVLPPTDRLRPPALPPLIVAGSHPATAYEPVP